MVAKKGTKGAAKKRAPRRKKKRQAAAPRPLNYAEDLGYTCARQTEGGEACGKPAAWYDEDQLPTISADYRTGLRCEDCPRGPRAQKLARRPAAEQKEGEQSAAA